MRYIWDDAKRRSNVAKHGLDFTAVERLTWKYAILVKVEVLDGEERELVFVPLRDRIAIVVYTMRGDTMRVISLRYATRREEQFFHENHA